MTNKLEALYILTKDIASELSRLKEHSVDRGELIEQVNKLIEKRETIIKTLQKPYSEEDINIGEQIILMNEDIKKQMDNLYNAVKDDVKHVQKKKAQNYSYLKPYGDLKTPDGIYMDNKL